MSESRNPMVRLVAWGWGQRARFTRFATVGFSGASLNLLVYALLYDIAFRNITDASLRDNLAWVPGVAIGLVNNFHWNRRWTWGDRRRAQQQAVWKQFVQYVAANWAGIVVTLSLKNLLSVWLPPLVAGMGAIGVACVINFLLNDLWTYRAGPGEGVAEEDLRLQRIRLAIPLAITGGILALCAYLFGLGSIYVPRNGDEWVYIDITRVTAAAGHWLPIRSDVEEMVNTRPTLLFWQGLVSTDWGHRWTLSELRWPGVLWSFLTSGLCGLLAWRMSGRDPVRGTIAALIYLAFFSTFRWGRPYNPCAIDTFLSFLILFVMLWRFPAGFRSRFLVPTAIAVLASLSMLARGPAQLVPLGAGLSIWYFHQERWRVRGFIARSLPRLAWVVLLALTIFGVTHLMHPASEAPWRESILTEVRDKFRGPAGAWLQDFLWGGNSIWRLAFGWFENAGLLAFPLFGVMVEAWKRRRDATDPERLLWLWAAATFVVFSLPSVRSNRNLLEAMPALAVLMAVRQHHVGRNAFMISIGASVAVVAGVGWVSMLLAREIGVTAFDWWFFPLIVGSIGLGMVAILRPAWTVPTTAPMSFVVMLALSGLLSVFDVPLGTYGAGTIEEARGRVVWVPETARASAEMHRFLLPGAEVRGFPAANAAPDGIEPGTGQWLVVWKPLDEPAPEGAIAGRIDLVSRHVPRQIWEMATGQVQKHLFRREWIVPAEAASPRP